MTTWSVGLLILCVATATSPAPLRWLYGVAQQRQQDLFDLTAVDVNQLQARGALKGDALGLTRTVLLHGAPDDFIQVVPLPIELRGLGKREEVADDAGGARDVVAKLRELLCLFGRIGRRDQLGAAEHALQRALEVLRQAGHELPDVDEPIGLLRLHAQRLELVEELLLPPACGRFTRDEHDDQRQGQKQ